MMVKNPAGARTMNPTRRQPQYLDLLLLMHRDAFAAGSDQSGRRSWWYNVGLRSPDYVLFYPPSFQVRGIRRRDTRSFQTLIQQLMNIGALSEAEAREALRPLYRLPE